VKTTAPLAPALRRWGPLLAVGGLLAAAAFAAMLGITQAQYVPSGGLDNSAAPPLPSDAPPPSAQPSSLDQVLRPPPTPLPAWVTFLILSVLAAMALAIVVAVIWALVRSWLKPNADELITTETDEHRLESQREAVRQAVEQGLVGLDEGDPRAAVIACWVRLEEAAAAAGTPREVSDTPTDLVTRLLSAHEVSAGVLDDLVAVYHEARYTTHPVDEAMRARARSALNQLRGELAGHRRAATVPAPRTGAAQ
jgi:hypothetical protein